ncbi:MAG: pullulanase [Calditrichaeota bacterium]|nr:pullulanase [Calditrichota bacterium]
MIYNIVFFKFFPATIAMALCVVLIFTLTAVVAQSRYPDYFPEQNKYFSTKSMGANYENGNTVFRVFAPNAEKVSLIIFKKFDDEQGEEFPMTKDTNGVWEISLSGERKNIYYGYRLDGPDDGINMYDPEVIVADPYSRAVVTKNNYHHPAKTLLLDTAYDWQGDTWVKTPIQDLVIYEMHVRDMTAHPSSGVKKAGTYLGLLEEGKTGGLDYLLDLGVNAVELLPCQEFANIEVPYKDKTAPVYNTWNPYARNHWGYMTSYFFAPESYYATDGTMEPGKYCGADGRQVREFKDMVKALHKKGIAVLMDVVYNHCSEYDFNPFKYIDKKYYFRLNEKGEFLAKSGCGNDFMTERPMARRLILESVKYWMTKYHIDGFRFDLAYLLDEQTCREIIAEAKKINPNVYIIAEPWGDGYAPDYFSRLGWAAWNDKIRNGVKGQNPSDNLGYIFGNWERDTKPDHLKRFILGSTVKDGGQFQLPEHSVNYLESHDDYTFGDFVRIGTKAVAENTKIIDLEKHVRLTEKQLKISKLGALFLFVSQGPVMIHEGQEFARSKVIAPTDAPDPHVGQIDHNSYDKDNTTNWINYRHREINRELYDYYRGLIQLRKKYPALRETPRENVHFLAQKNEFAFGFRIRKNRSCDAAELLVLMNGDTKNRVAFPIPEGNWIILVNGKKAGIEPLGKIEKKNVKLAPTTGMVLVKE